MTRILPVNVQGNFVSESMFGGNHLFTINISLNQFATALNGLGVSGLRYPGGTVTERHFNVTNPNQPLQDNRDPNSQSLTTGSFLSLTDFLNFSIARSEPVTFVLPTRNLLIGTLSTQDAPRDVDSSKVADVKSFVKNLLQVNGTLPDAEIVAFELGNEYWYEGEMTAREYGRVVNKLAIAVQEAIQESGLPLERHPKILIQMGEPFDQQYKAGGIYGNLPWLQKVAQANNQIISEITNIEAKNAIDGLIEHFYYIQEEDALSYSNDSTRFIGTDFAHWKRAGYEDVDLAITEWNIERDNAAQLGLKGAAVVIEQFESMIKLGVDSAFAWPIQHDGPNDLAGGAKSAFRLSPLGAAFKLLAESLPGAVLIETNQISNAVHVSAYGTQEKYVFFIMSRDETAQTALLDLSGIVPQSYTMSAVKLGLDSTSVDGKHWDRATSQFVRITQPWNEHDTRALLTNLIPEQIGAKDNLQISLGAFEVVRLEFIAPDRDMVGNGLNEEAVISGGSSDDHFRPALGRVAIDGGLGSDTVDYGNIVGPVQMDLQTGEAMGSASGHSYRNIEVIRGSNFGDKIVATQAIDEVFGGAGNDELVILSDQSVAFGDAGNDKLVGSSGNDRLYGGSGNDLLTGGIGSDTLDGGDDFDLVTYDSTGSVGAIASLSSPLVNRGEATGDVYVSIEGLQGTSQADVLIGDAQANVLIGSIGDDKLLGRDGNDSLFGGSGSDLIDGGNGFDSVLFQGANSVLFDLLNPSNNLGDANGDIYRSIEAFFGGLLGDGFYGNSLANYFAGEGGNDRLVGRGGNDTIVGGSGDDVIVGGAGLDQLYGGTGADLVIFGRGDGIDVLFDFSTSEGDRIQLSSDLFEGDLNPSEVVQRYGNVSGSSLTLSFLDNDELTLNGFTDASGFAASIEII
jgi:Ca2+-binding RTX toxin-like protein